MSEPDWKEISQDPPSAIDNGWNLLHIATQLAAGLLTNHRFPGGENDIVKMSLRMARSLLDEWKKTQENNDG